jgi:hypothetical protein
MKLIRPLLLAAGAAYVYKRFFADSGAGASETAAAEPFSSEQLEDQPEAAPEEPAEPSKDTLEQPTWLDPADAAKSDAG